MWVVSFRGRCWRCIADRGGTKKHLIRDADDNIANDFVLELDQVDIVIFILSGGMYSTILRPLHCGSSFLRNGNGAMKPFNHE